MPAKFDALEIQKLKKLNKTVNPFFIAASDEVGRGCLAGPVVAGTVYVASLCPYSSFYPNFKKFLVYLSDLGVNDSKSLSLKKRELILSSLRVIGTIGTKALESDQKILLLENKFLKVICVLSEIQAFEVDELNVLQASLKAMKDSFNICHEAERDGIWLVDGHMVPVNEDLLRPVTTKAVIGGDGKSLLIGLASVLAKNFRDTLMKKMEKLYPGYGLESHVGYPTGFHREALKRLGVSAIHRKTFKGVKELIQ